MFALRGHRMQAHVLRPHPTFAHLVATCGYDGQLLFWDIERGRRVNGLDIVSADGYPMVYDARWTRQANGVVDFVATDSVGRLVLVGTGSGSVGSAAPQLTCLHPCAR